MNHSCCFKIIIIIVRIITFNTFRIGEIINSLTNNFRMIFNIINVMSYIEQNVITLTVTAYSNTHKIVGKRIFKFIDDKYKISPVKRLEHITIEDLESAYLLSREEILKEIYKDLQGRINVLTDKIDKLQQFYNKNE